MRRPRFPESPFHMPSDPGARNHVAGLSVEQRLAALEESLRMAPKPGAAPSNGCVVTSDTSQTGGVKWQKSGYIVENVLTSSPGAFSAQDVTSLNLTGDGVTPIIIEWHIGTVSASTAARIITDIFDASGGGGTSYAKMEAYASSSAEVNGFNGFTQRLLFSGAKTFYLHLRTTAGTANFTANSGNPVIMRARWAP